MASKPDDVNERAVPAVVPPAVPALSELFKPGTREVDCARLKSHISTEGRLHPETAIELISMAKSVLMEEPNLIEIDAPVTVVGDLHGQFFDLLQVLEIGGPPENTQYLFLGDYVDRGLYSTEIVLLLYAYKISYPGSFTLVRGNHESRAMTELHNFKSECIYKYNEDVYEEFCRSFDALPLAALVHGERGRFLCMHGGLSPALSSIDDINKIYRFCEVPSSGPLCDMMWSDPIKEDTAAGLKGEELESWKKIGFVRNGQRGCSFVYGLASIKSFLDNNDLAGLIRAHEVQEEGFSQFYYFDEEREFPMVTTLFSAPNYCDKYGNKAAVMRYDGEKLRFLNYEQAEHPFALPNFMDAFTWSFPFIIEKVSQFFFGTLKMAEEGSSSSDDDMTEPDVISHPPTIEENIDDIEPGVTPPPAPIGTPPSTQPFRPRATAVVGAGKGRKRNNSGELRKRASSNVVNERFRSRGESLSTMIMKSKKIREKNDLLVKLASMETPPADDPNVQSGGGRQESLSRFEEARRADMKTEMKSPFQRHWTM